MPWAVQASTAGGGRTKLGRKRVCFTLQFDPTNLPARWRAYKYNGSRVGTVGNKITITLGVCCVTFVERNTFPKQPIQNYASGLLATHRGRKRRWVQMVYKRRPTGPPLLKPHPCAPSLTTVSVTGAIDCHCRRQLVLGLARA